MTVTCGTHKCKVTLPPGPPKDCLPILSFGYSDWFMLIPKPLIMFSTTRCSFLFSSQVVPHNHWSPPPVNTRDLSSGVSVVAQLWSLLCDAVVFSNLLTAC